MRQRPIALVLAGMLLAGVAFRARPAAQTPDAPRLLVFLVVDQMRADYVDRFQSDWTGGLKRMVTRGAWFNHAAYPYLNTVTCAGHATVATGAFPHTHGIVQNGWWDREAHAQTTCTADADARSITYGSETMTGDSAHYLVVPTLADLMRTQHGARVVSLALKNDSAIMMAGHGADAAAWMTLNGRAWVTSSAFSTSPVPAVASFIQSHPVAADFGKSWTRLLPAARYTQTDDGEAEAPPGGWTRTFPHVLSGTGNGPDAAFTTQWQRSPYSDTYLADLATTLVESMQLGRRGQTDVLAISFSAPDLIGHAFGPDSQEVQDIYAHLDQTLAALFDRLDALVGTGQYTVGLTADHGVTPIPEQLVKAGRDGGRLSAANVLDLVDTRVQAELGPGKYVARVNGSDVYFEPGMYAKLSANPSAMNAVLDAVRHSAGIADVYPAEAVRGAASSSDAMLRAAALSYFPGRSGDLILNLKPGWMFSPQGTTHGSGHPDDQRVPVIFYGKGIKAGTFPQPATPADVAPTLAAVYGIRMPNAEGVVQTVALTGSQRRPASAPSSKRN